MRVALCLGLLLSCGAGEPPAFPSHEGPEPMSAPPPRSCLDAAAKVRATAIWTDEGLVRVHVEALSDVRLDEKSNLRSVGATVEKRVATTSELTADLRASGNRVSLDIDGQSCDDGTHRGTIVVSIAWTGDASTRPAMTTTLGSSPLGFN